MVFGRSKVMPRVETPARSSLLPPLLLLPRHVRPVYITSARPLPLILRMLRRACRRRRTTSAGSRLPSPHHFLSVSRISFPHLALSFSATILIPPHRLVLVLLSLLLTRSAWEPLTLVLRWKRVAELLWGLLLQLALSIDRMTVIRERRMRGMLKWSVLTMFGS